MVKLLTYVGQWMLRGWCVVAISTSAIAQSNFQLRIVPVVKDSVFVMKMGLKSAFTSQPQCQQYVTTLPKLLQSKGYLGAAIDTVLWYDGHAVAHVFFGGQYSIARLTISTGLQPAILLLGYPASSLQNISFDRFQQLQKVLLDNFESTGYPFASVQLDSMEIIGDRFNAVLDINKGSFYKMDSIQMLGPAKISRNFMHRYLNLPPGEGFNRQKLDKVDQRLLELPYLQQAQPWDVSMLNTGSTLNLYLAPKKSNQINVLAGFLPDNRQLGGGKLLFTIDANLQLKNAFGSGENVGLVWQQIQPRSPRLNLLYQQPYLFKSPFGIDFTFDLLKKDSLFLNLDAQLGVRYNISTTQSVKVGFQNLQTNVLQVDTLTVKVTKRLPDVADVSSLNLLVDYQLQQTNYRFNPSKGNEMLFSIAIGNKRVRKNNNIVQLKDPNFNFNALYDSVKLTAYQLRVKLVAAHYFKIGRQSVLKTGLNAGWYQSPNNFRNELFQIGGYRLLRGFDEESIFANQYSVVTIEYRYLLGLNSYFFGFTDLGVSSFKSQLSSFSNQYVGGGIGLAFETKGGIFNISYAAGKRNDLPFNLKESKIHFGYVSIF